jgi:plastocyanin
MRYTGRILAAMVLAALVTACGTGEAATSGSAPTVEPTGRTVEVAMKSIGGEVFGPDEVTVQRGDVVRFVLESGVHNVSFPADQNLTGVKLPEASPYLQVPGQYHDILIDLPAGEYTFHCDPHAALGMVGKLTVLE